MLIVSFGDMYCVTVISCLIYCEGFPELLIQITSGGESAVLSRVRLRFATFIQAGTAVDRKVRLWAQIKFNRKSMVRTVSTGLIRAHCELCLELQVWVAGLTSLHPSSP